VDRELLESSCLNLLNAEEFTSSVHQLHLAHEKPNPTGTDQIQLNAIGKKLLQFISKLGAQHPIRAETLLDSGADRNYISCKTANKIAAKRHSTNPLSVKLPSGQTVLSREAITIPASIGTFHFSLTARVIDIQGWDLILGYEWLEQWNPYIDWRSRTLAIAHQVSQNPDMPPRVHFLRGDSPVMPIDLDSANEDIVLNAMSYSEWRRQNPDQGYIWALRTTTPDHGTQELPVAPTKGLQQVLAAYKDVFRDSLPNEPPPKRI
jgi:hypothetical protein